MTASGGVSYLWNTGATTSGLSVSSAGTYTVTVTEANGCTASSSITINSDTVIPNAGITNNTGTSTLTCATTSISLTATGGNSYLWSTGATTANLSVTTAGTYTVTVTGSNGCIATADITINSNTTAPIGGITNNSGTSTLTCSTTAISLTASGGTSYLWNTGATTANISATSAGTYSVTVTAANGCTSTASVGIGVNTTAPTASITNNTGTSSITCLVPTISLTASGNGSFLWSTGATTANISVTTGGTYAVTVTGSNGCTTTASVVINSNNGAPIAGITNNTGSNTLTCSISSISLTATGGATYLWSTGATTANISVNAAGTYTVTVTGANGCSASSSIVINTNTSAPQAFIYASGSTTFCQGGSVTLTASSAGTGGSYLWSNGATTQAISATTSGSFVVTVTYSNGCKSTSAAATVTATPFVNTSVTITSNAPATTTATTSITFTATPVGGGQSPIYQWKKNGVNVGTNSAIYTNNAWVNGDVVNVVMTSSAPCANGSPATSNSITINVSGPVAKYLVVDITANRAYYYTSTWTFITSNPLSTTILNGVTNAEDVVSTGGAVYVLDGTNKTVYRSTAANTASTESKTLRTNTGQALGNIGKGMAIKGDSLYIA
ncbi:MAG: beta strand repeat-containing protein, partial [Bacteroidota bacterium]